MLIDIPRILTGFLLGVSVAANSVVIEQGIFIVGTLQSESGATVIISKDSDGPRTEAVATTNIERDASRAAQDFSLFVAKDSAPTRYLLSITTASGDRYYCSAPLVFPVGCKWVDLGAVVHRFGSLVLLPSNVATDEQNPGPLRSSNKTASNMRKFMASSSAACSYNVHSGETGARHQIAELGKATLKKLCSITNLSGSLHNGIEFYYRRHKVCRSSALCLQRELLNVWFRASSRCPALEPLLSGTFDQQKEVIRQLSLAINVHIEDARIMAMVEGWRDYQQIWANETIIPAVDLSCVLISPTDFALALLVLANAAVLMTILIRFVSTSCSFNRGTDQKFDSFIVVPSSPAPAAYNDDYPGLANSSELTGDSHHSNRSSVLYGTIEASVNPEEDLVYDAHFLETVSFHRDANSFSDLSIMSSDAQSTGKSHKLTIHEIIRMAQECVRSPVKPVNSPPPRMSTNATGVSNQSNSSFSLSATRSNASSSISSKSFGGSSNKPTADVRVRFDPDSSFSTPGASDLSEVGTSRSSFDLLNKSLSVTTK